MTNTNTKLWLINGMIAVLAACGSQLNSRQSGAGSSSGLQSGSITGDTKGTTSANCGSGDNTNSSRSALPKSWLPIAGSQGYRVVLANSDGALWAGLASDSNHEYYSVDGGNTWTQLAVDSDRCYPGTPTSDNNIVYGHCFPVGSDPEITSPILAVSHNGGSTWNNLAYAFAIDSADPTNPNVAYAHEAHKGAVRFPGPYVTRDAGATWTPVTSEPNFLVEAVGPTSGEDIYAGGFIGSQVYVDSSHDGGASWTRVPFKGDNVEVVAASATTVYGDAIDKELDVSHDSGATWVTIYPSCVSYVQVAPWDPNFVLAAPCGTSAIPSRWMGSTDGGGTWQPVTVPQACSAINEFAFNKTQQTLTAVCSNGLFSAVYE